MSCSSRSKNTPPRNVVPRAFFEIRVINVISCLRRSAQSYLEAGNHYQISRRVRTGFAQKAKIPLRAVSGLFRSLLQGTHTQSRGNPTNGRLVDGSDPFYN